MLDNFEEGGLLMRAERGVTLVELLIGVAAMAVLLAAGIPSFSNWIQNAQIRDAAGSLQSGLNLARVEAVRRNTAVRLALDADASWTVGCDAPINAPINDQGASEEEDTSEGNNNDCPAAIQTRPASGNAGRASITMSQVAAASGTTVVAPAAASILAFNGLGRVGSGLSAGRLAVFDIRNPDAGACAPEGPMRCLRVVVTTPGQVRMCDPAVTAGDPRRC